MGRLGVKEKIVLKDGFDSLIPKEAYGIILLVGLKEFCIAKGYTFSE
tara:strand:+ start:526 stop:666 length:141 start_codon:yes stop_codon:yes gene_type:complete